MAATDVLQAVIFLRFMMFLAVTLPRPLNHTRQRDRNGSPIIRSYAVVGKTRRKIRSNSRETIDAAQLLMRHVDTITFVVSAPCLFRDGHMDRCRINNIGHCSAIELARSQQQPG